MNGGGATEVRSESVTVEGCLLSSSDDWSEGQVKAGSLRTQGAPSVPLGQFSFQSRVEGGTGTKFGGVRRSVAPVSVSGRMLGGPVTQGGGTGVTLGPKRERETGG